MAWFGPKGVASMLFALIVLESAVEHGSLIFKIAAFTILCSILAHGLTDTVGARWVERRLGRRRDWRRPASASITARAVSSSTSACLA